MSQKVKLRIPEESVLPFVAASVSVLAAIITVINYMKYRSFNSFAFTLLCLGLPLVGMLSFAIFSIVFAKKRLVLMSIPVFLICSYFLMLESGIIDYILGYKEFFEYLWSYNKLDVAVMILRLLLIFALMVTALLTYAGVIKNTTIAITVCAVNTIATFTYELFNYLRMDELIYFWKILSLFVVIIAIFISMSSIVTETEEPEEKL